jgi:membrane fusion protein (multidrug efflux system)
VDPGEFVGRGEPVVELVDTDKVEVEVNVPELDVKYLRAGEEVLLRVDALPEETFSGRIEFVSYKADPLTKTFRVKVLVENQAGRIRPGMIVRVAMLRQVVPDALTAPLFALVDKGGERILFVEQDGIARSRTVSLGIIDGDRVQITQGLEPGDRLIVTGQTQVEDGIRVQVL